MKKAKVSVPDKREDISRLTNYHPIFILPVILKCHEKIIHSRLVTFFWKTYSSIGPSIRFPQTTACCTSTDETKRTTHQHIRSKDDKWYTYLNPLIMWTITCKYRNCIVMRFAVILGNWWSHTWRSGNKWCTITQDFDLCTIFTRAYPRTAFWARSYLLARFHYLQWRVQHL